jgi:hypothetical protein
MDAADKTDLRLPLQFLAGQLVHQYYHGLPGVHLEQHSAPKRIEQCDGSLYSVHAGARLKLDKIALLWHDNDGLSSYAFVHTRFRREGDIS